MVVGCDTKATRNMKQFVLITLEKYINLNKWSLLFYFPKTCRSFICKLTMAQLCEFDEEFFEAFPFEVFENYTKYEDFERLHG